jgi:hypothetical protein
MRGQAQSVPQDWRGERVAFDVNAPEIQHFFQKRDHCREGLVRSAFSEKSGFLAARTPLSIALDGPSALDTAIDTQLP